ncbi:hypothetical protein SARC_12382 [Sphaeroforma arctica JP610]|uniref:Uncharacterized protein n=1 Tax=Sphaeroforma arctica JP610 TaxID=667725 RepID=A0A0L0FGE1_9EUKA|nr:hypothetical protein SARC_12382 [Sphaeroforma arctica JP610]KNC75088.1 hypothetical protein SARC_12382 [Sphaeroforma arctica JP610]|eukprot:XP_014148990.1 hypothetical protein SARC_12382 [Sphaeroforma arctica JP610]
MARNYVDFLGQAVLDRPVLVGGIMLICILVAWAIYSLPGFDEEEEFGELTEAESALRDAIMTGANDDTINKAKKAVYEERVKHGGRPVAAAPVADKAVKQPKKNTKLMDGKVSEPKAEQKPPNKSSNKGSKGKKEKKKSK